PPVEPSRRASAQAFAESEVAGQNRSEISSRSQQALRQSPNQKWDPVFHKGRDEHGEHHQGGDFGQRMKSMPSRRGCSPTRLLMLRARRSTSSATLAAERSIECASEIVRQHRAPRKRRRRCWSAKRRPKRSAMPSANRVRERVILGQNPRENVVARTKA